MALAWICLLEALFRGAAADHFYFHPWTSEYMMQTVSVRDLRAEPFKSLWYNHIQPPVFDAIRAVLVALSPQAEGDDLIRSVDAGLYRIWMMVYAVTVATIFSWLRQACGLQLAVLGFCVFLVLPGPIFYAAFLDSTLLSSTLVLLFFWILWRFGRGDEVAGRLVIVSILLVLTRSVFQWPFLMVLGASLMLMRVPIRKVSRVLLPISLVMIAFQAKQYVLFGLTTTSSFGPGSFCRALSQRCPGTTVVPLPKMTDSANALVLRRIVKLNGRYNYNQKAFLKTSFSEMTEFKERFRVLTFGQILDLAKINFGIFLRPTSRYSAHVIVDHLPWRDPLDIVLSGWRVGVLVTLSTLVWVSRWRRLPRDASGRALFHGVGLLLPALYIAAVSILFESGENNRFRFFLEPTIFVFFCMSLSEASNAWRSRRAARIAAHVNQGIGIA
ncbi:MAG: hypothetical protein ABI565_05145 [Vicinamibacteria bacterium]